MSTDRAICGLGGYFAWNQLGSNTNCSTEVACSSPTEECANYGLQADWTAKPSVNYPHANVQSSSAGQWVSLQGAQESCISTRKPANPFAQRCEAVIHRYNPAVHDYAFDIVRDLGEPSIDPNCSTYFFHEIGQCSPKVDFGSLIREAAVYGNSIGGSSELKLDASEL